MYWNDNNLWKQDLATGTIQMLPDIPQPEGYHNERWLACSPDNSALLFKQFLPTINSYGLTMQTDTRLYRVLTDGTDCRLLYRTKGKQGNFSMVCSWQHGFAIVYYCPPGYKTAGSDASMLYLQAGGAVSLAPLEEGVADLTIRPDGKEITWATPCNTIYSRTLDNGITRKLPISGMHPAWSPNGQQLAFIEDNIKLCVWDAQREQAEVLLWFAPPPSQYDRHARFFGKTPLWSPDGNMFWFAAMQEYTWQPPRTLFARLQNATLHLQHVLHNLNPGKKNPMPREHPNYEVKQTGTVDLSTRQVWLTNGIEYGVTWLPRPENMDREKSKA